MAVLSKRSHEGYAMIDHTDSPGITPEFIKAHNLDAPAVPGGVKWESAVKVCHCCGNDIIQNPDRSRVQAYCRKHDSYTCDNCALLQKLGAPCITYQEKLAKWYDAIVRRSQIV